MATVLSFEDNELIVDASILDELEDAWQFLHDTDEDFVAKDDDGCIVGFRAGTYRLHRPEHVSKINPFLADLSIWHLDS